MSSNASFEEMKKKYFRIFLALLALTAVTVGVTTIHFGDTANILVGVLVAIAKASLVAAVFMHLKFDNKRLRLFVYIPSFFFLVLVLALTRLGL
jgi:cytochrome c oxidase subunit IV